MKTPRYRFAFFAAVALLCSASPFVMGQKASREASEEVRLLSAKAKLSDTPDTVVLYAKGLCCPSCAIGIRKMVSKLDFVDQNRFNKGVHLDTKTQLVTIAIGNGLEADFDSLAEAVDNAGYEPARAYFIVNNEFTTRSIELPAAN